MASPGMFISYSSKDADFVGRLRRAIVSQGVENLWTDVRHLIPGDPLEEEIFSAIKSSDFFFLVVSPDSMGAKWVIKETKYAMEVAKARDNFRVVPLLLDGTQPPVLEWLLGREVAGIFVDSGPMGISAAMPEILTALGLELPVGPARPEQAPAEPIEELVLKLIYPKMRETEGVIRATADARLVMVSSDPRASEVESRRFTFTAPLGPIEMDDLKWYLEKYYLWPVGVFRDRAKTVEKNLVEWGKKLYAAAMPHASCKEPLHAWNSCSPNAERRFSVLVDEQGGDNEDSDNAADDENTGAGQAAATLLALPWELLHDELDYLFQGNVRVRRRLPNRVRREVPVSDPPVRILLITARPEDDSAGYIDHRASALPLVSALETLGDLAELTVLSPAAFPEMQAALQRAEDLGKPFHVVHFDGHGVYDRQRSLGGLCFEDPEDAGRLEKRRSKIVFSHDLAKVISHHRIPLVFLEACQSAQSDETVEASVASALLEQGVASVIAMSHSVLVETARRFVTEFYQGLVTGKRVGKAMLLGQRALKNDTFRMKVIGAGRLDLEDWFVPVLFQEKDDPQLFETIPTDRIREIFATERKYRMGNLPEPLKHGFVGRSRELLTLERLLAREPWAVICGQGGEGKTALASELARWLVRTGRFQRAVFVSAEDNTHPRAILDSMGRQLAGPNYSVTDYDDGDLLGKAFQPLARELRESPAIIILDNMETILPPRSLTGNEYNGEFTDIREALYDPRELNTLLELCRRLLDTGKTRIVFTSRESLPEGFENQGNTIFLSRMDKTDAVDLVTNVMARKGIALKENETGTQPEVEALVDAVHRHARSLVLLAPHIHELGIEKTTEALGRIMADIHKKFPDSREQSLFASVELSLRRLSSDVRETARMLGVFHGGAHLGVLRAMGVEEDMLEKLATELEETGLAERMSYGHLRLNPGLCPYLAGELDEETTENLREAWAEGMKQFAGFLYEQQFQDARMSAALTILELPDLLALLAYLEKKDDPRDTVNAAISVESLLEYLGRPRILGRVAAIREKASKGLGEWNNTGFTTAKHDIERLLQNRRLKEALDHARGLLEKSLEAGESAYPGAAYDIAMAHLLLGSILKTGGASDQAVSFIAQAQKRFQALADEGNTSAARMASACLTETGDCLRNLGRLDDAAAAYEEGIKIDEKLNDSRGVATGKFQLGTVRMFQKRYREALDAYESARDIFGKMGEPGSVATAWHQIGMVHQESGNFASAEDAYRKSLAIQVRQNNPAGEASSLGQLGNLCDKLERLEEAVIFYRQAADKYVAIGDLAKEGVVRNNIADTLIKLSRYDDARGEIMRAIECYKPYGHAAQPWTAYAILHNLENATNHPEAAAEARQNAMDLFLAYRRDGGENHNPGGRLCHRFFEQVKAGQIHEIKEHLKQLTHPSWKPLVSALQAILSGSRDPALAKDPALNIFDAAEVILLMERLKE